MGAAESSVQRDATSQEDASVSASAAELSAIQEGGGVLESKAMQKNGQISSMSSLNGHSEDNTLAEVGQPDVSVAQKEEASETMDAIQDEVAPQVNEDKEEKATDDANDISVVEEKAAEEKSEDASEVGFKKIFRFVGFKFTLKKDKVEEDPVKLLTVKDKEEEEVSKTEEPTKEKEEAIVEESAAETKEIKAEESNAEVIADGDKAETTESVNEAAVKEGDPKEPDATVTSPETSVSPFRKLFNTGLFSNLKKKTSIKKTKEEEEKEVAPEGETEKKEEAAAASVDAKEELKSEAEQETEKKEPETETTVQDKAEPKEEAKTGPPEELQVTQEDKIQPCVDEESGTVEVTSEAELLSSQEKTKATGSPLKKLFTGAGLKKLSTKKQRTKKETETKADSGEVAAEQLQSATESAEAPNPDSGPSSPEESGEHAEVPQIESSQESHGEVADGERKKEGIIAWSSFKKLVMPKRRVKQSSDSDEEAPEEKPGKTATLSSSESAALTDKCAEEETKEDQPTEETDKLDTDKNADKLESTEEPKKKMDTSVSWEALMCMGGPKKRTRKTSDSDDEETKIDEELQPAAEGEQEAEAAIVTSQTSESDGKFGSSGESAWDTLKRVVMPKPKAKVEEKPGDSPEQVQSDNETQKEESSFSFKKFLPGRRKKKADKHPSDQGSSEDDSDTPAVVPLSEYNEQVETKEEAVAESVAAQADVSADDRSPSWIPAAVEETDQPNELSDIAEEAETAATSKSVDTDIAEDESEDEPAEPPKPSQYTGRRLSRAEVKPVVEAPTGETTPVAQSPKPDNADEVREGIDVLVSEIPAQTSATVSDVPIEVASEKIEYEPSTDTAEAKINTLLEPHAREEAMAICTGLGTREIAKLALEKPAMPIIESVAVVGNMLSTEVAVEDKPDKSADANVAEVPLLRAQVHQVETTSLEPAVETSTNDISVIQTASEYNEPEVENIGIVTTVVEAEILQPITTSETSSKTVFVNSIAPTTEEPVCTKLIEVTEHTIEMKETDVEIQKQYATQEYTALNLVAEAISKTTKISVTKEAEVAIPVSVPVEEVPVITKTKVLVGPKLDIGVDQVEMADVEPIQNEAIEVQETSECVSAVESEDPNVVVDQCQENVEQIEAEVQEASDIEAQSMVITQAVIQDAVDKVSETVEEPKKPSTPTASIPTPVQAEASTEKEVEVSTETAEITDIPNVLSCEKSPKPLCVAMELIDLVPVETANSLSASKEEEEDKPQEDVKQAVEVQLCNETVILEEAKEIVEDQEQNKEDTGVQGSEIKDVVEEVEKVNETEQPKSEAPMKDENLKALEIHMPVQVVLQTAQVMEEVTVEEEAAEEFDSNGPVVKDTGLDLRSTVSPSKLSKLVEEPHVMPPEDSEPSQVAEVATSQPEEEVKSPEKCAQVMAQVIEVIEEAVKEIEPVMADNLPAS
ncbi:A-kinase anchor protein 12b isoform X1 [Takifugu flavidus]|uniref:A-kinase anchor protein 12 n=1 Tax=Takifugu flavidus TaxID=433684 RepID=A0A5C6NMK6_9TELE|nr:A-kinase anchor protein 12b isoform X1 [Takifugu flavidus]TWW68822.1 A-kinase anchor protein 12 [Takifugu flavidus]